MRESTLDQWLFGHVCPFWMDAIVDPAGGYFEGIDAAGVVDRGGRRTVLNQARLTYVFSHAHCLQPDTTLLQSARHGFHFLQRVTELAGTDGGWPHAITAEGTALDATRDAYDQAFVIFAMAWYFRASGDHDALRLSEQTYAFMQTHLADHEHGGFFEEYPLQDGAQKLPRRQNPHMHLLEAMLAMYQASGQACWLDRARSLVELFEQHFFDAETGSLIEYFNVDWSPAEGAAGALREPGHHFEWVWLLHEFFRVTQDARVMDYAEQLFEFGTRFGIDTDGPLAGLVFDGVDRYGAVVADTKLFWPQTEYIKACAALAVWLDEPRHGLLALTHVAALQQHFFKADGASWHNQLSRAGTPLQSATPARVLYHLFLALAEVLPVAHANQNFNKTGTHDGR